MKPPLLVLLLAGWLAGCDKPISGFAPPAPHLMKPAEPFPTMAAGDDVRDTLARAAAVHNKNTRKVRGLQKYIRLIQKG